MSQLIYGKEFTFDEKEHHVFMRDLIRFWSYVDIKEENECWDWTASLDQHGYGRFKMDDCVTAHRASYFFETGEWAPQYVLHDCDRPSCVNPKHLRAGTPRDNVIDMISRSRQNWPSGELADNARLTNHQAYLLREMHREFGVTHSELGRWVGLTRRAIAKIVKNKSYRKSAV